MSCKHSFFTGQPIFSQILQIIPKSLVSRLAKEHNANRYCKTFKAYDHMVTMLYQGFFQCLSLRELTTGLQANAERLKHLGLLNTPRRSTISDANKRRSEQFFQDLYHHIYQLYYPRLPDSRSAKDLFIIDSTTISLFSNIMKGAGCYNAQGKKKGGAKAHVVLDSTHNLPCFVRITEGSHSDVAFLKEVVLPANSIVVFDKGYVQHKQFNTWANQNITWITRQRVHATYEVEKNFPVCKDAGLAGIVCDQQVMLGRPSNEHISPLVKARRIVYVEPQTKKEFVFITNSTEPEALQIAAIYRQRWQIELLFKRIKQRYPLRYFLGDNENAIKIQIWCMLICDLLVQIIMKQIHQRGKRKWSYANLSSMIKHHLMTYIHLIGFLKNPERALLNYKHPQPMKATLF